MQKEATICVVGGSGFVGRHVVQALVEKGYRVKIIARNPLDAAHTKVLGKLGQVAFAAGDVLKPETVTRHFAGAYAVVNLTGILFAKGKQQFIPIHARAPEELARGAKQMGVPVFVQMSALGIEKASDSAYANSKKLGEEAVRGVFPSATIIRPSVIFGPEDNFFNMFASFAEKLPALPLIGGGKTKFQPVYVGDVAEAIAQSVIQASKAAGKTFELGGPDVLSFKQILEYILKITGHKACLFKLPFSAAKVIAVFSELRSRPKLTRDQVTLLKYDNVLSGEKPGMEALGISATPMNTVVPEYLATYKKREVKL